MSLKIKRALKITGFDRYPRTAEHIVKNIEASITSHMSSKDIAALITVANKSYHDGQNNQSKNG